ncbi:ABC transporter ATP-binding protein [uncultured Propionibacterium sp.]|uniref:energy-coupling factor ABC transporter ATP-binding protein n=1 Tax=uncultured Propionibacterium sp. TaxID=218066 RepID=UPI00292DF391|nr:ABC transporter ATP-binding protein [uncultured Propionibacterium sp.]
MIEYRQVGVEVDGYDIDGNAMTTRILRDVDLSLPQRRIAVIGANGSGKSTLLKLVNGLMKATTGQVLVEGLDPAREGRAVRRRVGHVFTDPNAQLVMATPLEEIELSLRASVRNRAERRTRALEVLASHDLGYVANRSVHALSGGERQLVALASVLAVEPSIIIADEPTTLLDLRNRIILGRAFEALDQQLVCSTHDLELAARMDRALLVDGGRVVDDGEPSGVIARYREQMAGCGSTRAGR